MAIEDRQRARSMAFQLASDLAKAHADELERLLSEWDVETALEGPIEKARTRYRKKIAPSLHSIFEDAVDEKLVQPVAKRIAREREAEDREAVRVDAGYRTGEAPSREGPQPAPKKERRRKPKRKRKEPGLADYRQVGTLFIALGVLLTVAMAAIAVITMRKHEEVPWISIVLFPVMWLGIGFWMRNANNIPDGD